MTSLPASRVVIVSNDAQLMRRALARDGAAVRTIVEQNNRRLYRIDGSERPAPARLMSHFGESGLIRLG
jgi:hypothetical protein